MFDPVPQLILGLLTGMIFGFLIQKGRLTRFHVIVGQFLLKDWTVVKIMGTAIIVGAIGIYALLPLELASLHIKPLLLGGVVVGGICFGVGMILFGYFPGAGVAACGEGRRDAFIGVLGMFAGAFVYVAGYPLLRPIIRGLGEWGEITFPSLTGTPGWPWVIGLAVFGGLGLWWLERLERPSPLSPRPRPPENARTAAGGRP